MGKVRDRLLLEQKRGMDTREKSSMCLPPSTLDCDEAEVFAFESGWHQADLIKTINTLREQFAIVEKEMKVLDGMKTAIDIELWFDAGRQSRLNGNMCPRDMSPDQASLHSKGWVYEDLRQGLIKADPIYASNQAAFDVHYKITDAKPCAQDNITLVMPIPMAHRVTRSNVQGLQMPEPDHRPAFSAPMVDVKAIPQDDATGLANPTQSSALHTQTFGRAERRKHNHYYRPCPFDAIDVYRILHMFEVTDPCAQHAIKKLLAIGKRGHKDADKDVQDVIDTMTRYQNMRKEEGNGS